MTGWSVDGLSLVQSCGVKLILLGGTMGVLHGAGLLSDSPVPPVTRLDTPPAHSARAVRVDINHGSLEQLETLPSIGPVLAERIVRYRREHGQFTSPQELRRVKGIGVKRVQQLRPLVRVGEVRRLHRTDKARGSTGASARGAG